MDKSEFLNNIEEPICAFSNENKLIYKNKLFYNAFPDFKSIEKFKKRFNYINVCFLSTVNLKNKTPIDLILQSKENFHTVCTYQNKNEEYLYYYLYTFILDDIKVLVFKDITIADKMNGLEKQYQELEESYNKVKESTEKFEKLKEHAQAQVLKMGIINRISMVIRETNNIETILLSALNEIHNLLGSYKTYYSDKEKNNFKIRYSLTEEDKGIITGYEEEINESIRNKKITVNICLKEYINAPAIMNKGTKRIIIPVYYKNKLLGIIVSFTNQRFDEKGNSEILQSIAVQLASSIIQADLIEELDKKNKKLGKTLNELKDTQIQLINTEKMASIGQLVAGVAHEINTPLASINSNNGMINKIINTNKNMINDRIEILQELNSLNIEASTRISNIVKSLKRFVRLDEAELQEADINSEIDLTLKLVDHEVKKNTKIIKKYGEIPRVKCYVNMINQVFMNLLVNACHSIDGRKNEGIIEITTISNEKNLIVKIKDNGCGITPENRNKIFTAGFTTKKAGIGTGLGLSISKKIIEMHKGNITFTTKENEGSEFVVTIPINK